MPVQSGGRFVDETRARQVPLDELANLVTVVWMPDDHNVVVDAGGGQVVLEVHDHPHAGNREPAGVRPDFGSFPAVFPPLSKGWGGGSKSDGSASKRSGSALSGERKGSRMRLKPTAIRGMSVKIRG